MDPRHARRVRIVQNLFAFSFPLKENLPYDTDETTKDIIDNIVKIDELISTYAPKFPLERIAKTDLSILRLAIYELIINVNKW